MKNILLKIFIVLIVLFSVTPVNACECHESCYWYWFFDHWNRLCIPHADCYPVWASNGWYNSIQDAIDAADWGDFIFLRDGYYYEDVYIDKSITLYGGYSCDWQSYGGISTIVGNISVINGQNYFYYIEVE
jgi:hypothetical protein